MSDLFWTGLAIVACIALIGLAADDAPVAIVWMSLTILTGVFWFFAIKGVIAWIG